ncbi:hypothetical protein FPE01S_02_01490 [Flavihumibacter petaseus NBRC 106054]|uniref:ParB/Sulfiredoxin domain-containing protein n=1 Tax=Flavihumibacter petaseus NBRC 106054 TaxID=1220578 RepID=A0A0E9MZQ0_9BACT|nr:hypothetical protein FPE01S_02_01490 [Flavihumibacter petaseus NBRC 106054]
MVLFPDYMITRKIIEDFIATDQLMLNSTQKKMCVPIINRMFLLMKTGVHFPAIRIYDNLIIDGHHRYLASRLCGYEISMVPSEKSSATVATDWQSVVFEEVDWEAET